MLVFDSFCLLAGLTREEAGVWLPLCHWAAASLFGRLRVGVDLVANGELLARAAGAMAYYKYVLRTASRETASTFSAGDVKVVENTRQTVAAAKDLYEVALRSVEHLFGEDEMCFMGVAWQ